MLILLLILLFLVVVSLFLIVPAICSWEIYEHYRGSRAVVCPENHRQVAVRFDVVHAAVTGMGQRAPSLRLADCTRWPAKARCDQACIVDALQAEPYTQGEASRPRAKKIYHVPVVIAAFAAWVLGATWHSEYVFRGRWGQILGLTDLEVRRIAEWWGPHLLSVGMALLFAYGVAWLLALSGRKGVWWGTAISLGVWAWITAASLLGFIFAELPIGILKIELGYTFLASVVIGAIIGGLSGRLLEARFEGETSHFEPATTTQR